AAGGAPAGAVARGGAPAAGQGANQLKQDLEQALAARREALQQQALARELAGSDFDPSEPGPARTAGALHPITIVQNELVDLFTSMGFSWQDGPAGEAEHFNFDALHIP